MGKAPQPFYDPLAFAIEEAHRRGLELHAWFNPFRARLLTAKSPAATNHISRTRPQLVRQYGEYLWLDPGEREVQDYSLRVIMDVVKRYDVDGVHFDDYFYPYQKRASSGRDLDFPDDASWQTFRGRGEAHPRRLAARERQQFIQRVCLIDQGGKTLGEIRHQSVRHLAPEEPAPDPRDRRLCVALRRFTQMARQRLGRLLRAAALLDD